MNKRKIIALCAALSLSCSILGGCGQGEAVPTQGSAADTTPEISQIRSICELATLECFYHNVAKQEKSKGTGVIHWGEKDRKLWMEYDGKAKIGIETSEIEMETDRETNVITIRIPEAKILSVEVVDDSFTKDSYIFTEDGWNSNSFTADDQTEAINAAQETMQETIMADSSLLMDAQNRAKDLIDNYIKKLGEAMQTEYNVQYEFAENASEESEAEAEK